MNLRFPMKISGIEISNLKEFVKKADEGYGEVQNKLGECFFLGMGVPKDMKKAKKYFELAVQNESSQGMINLGFLSAKGIAGDRNCEYAERLYLKAYELGDIEAATCLGEMYIYGMGDVLPDVSKGFSFLKEAYDKDLQGAKELVEELGGKGKFMEIYHIATNPNSKEEAIKRLNDHFLQYQPAEYRN